MELYHYGIKGQKWGVKNGPPYPLTTKQKVFISGSSKTQNKDSVYYRKNLPKPIQKKLKEYEKTGSTILVGDAPGIDRQIQDFLKDYENVIVYSPGMEPRYKANSKWNSNLTKNSSYKERTDEWLAEKDIRMTNDSTQGLAIILDNGSSATRNNINRLLDQNKNVEIFQLSANGKEYDGWIEHI